MLPIFAEIRHLLVIHLWTRPILMGPSVPEFFWDLLYMRAHGVRNSNQVLHDDQTRWEENFYRVDHATCPGQKFM